MTEIPKLDVDCYYLRCGECKHGLAPSRLFGLAKCLLIYRSEDVRVPDGCRLKETEAEVLSRRYPLPTTAETNK